MKKAVMTGSPKARQELPEKAWREITAPMVIYEEDKELMTMLSGEGTKDVRMKNSLGDDLLAETIVISTKEGDERITGTRIEGVMKIDESKPPPGSGGG
jgi:hypothetical protein